MNANALTRRIATLEQELSPRRRVVCVVVNEFDGETLPDAVARQWPEGSPPDVSPLGVITGVPRGVDLVVVEVSTAEGSAHACA